MSALRIYAVPDRIVAAGDSQETRSKLFLFLPSDPGLGLGRMRTRSASPDCFDTNVGVVEFEPTNQP